ncbi:MAG: NAD(+)--rifampin ADP-ribosyltransferase [Dermatophilaceae bacterium]
MGSARYPRKAPSLHGTRAAFAPGNRTAEAGHRTTGQRYLHELAAHHREEGRSRTRGQRSPPCSDRRSEPHVYLVTPTGGFEDDPNVTDRFPGNPTAPTGRRHPLVVIEDDRRVGPAGFPESLETCAPGWLR